MLRVVLDTNIFVSSLLSKTGIPAKILDAWRAGQYLLITSPPIIAEIKNVLESFRISKKYFITQEDIEQLVDLLQRDAITVSDKTDVKGAVSSDPKDEMFLACALDAGADLIVSGDHHILDLEEYKGIRILTARRFSEYLSNCP